jgi:nucleotide-binding universal stress UspA family protein
MEEFRKILVPVDGSELSTKALVKALRLSKAFGSEITVIHVTEPTDISLGAPVMGGSEMSVIMLQNVTLKEGKKVISTAKALAKKHGVSIRVLKRDGHASNEIINASRDFDLIVMGTHGRGGLAHLLIGSVAEKVARHAYCPVLLIRDRYSPDG